MILSIHSYASECVEDSKELFNSKQYNKSINKIYGCIDDVIDSKLTGELSELYYGLGINYSKLGSLDSSLKYFKLARFTSKSINNGRLKALINNEIAINYTKLGLNHKSIKFLKNSLALNLRMNRKKGIIINYINLGHSFLNISMLDSAYYYYNMAYNLNPKNQNLRTTILNNMASVEFSLGNLANSESLLEKALENKKLSKEKEQLYKGNYDIVQIAQKKEPLFKNFTLQNTRIETNKYNFEADLKYKKSVYAISEGNNNEALDYISSCNQIYSQKKNYTKAKIALTNFLTILESYKNDNTIHYDVQKQLTDIILKEQYQYSNILLAETQRNLKINKEIKVLNSELYNASMSIYILISLILSLVVLIPVSIKYVVVNRLLNRVKSYNAITLNEIQLLHNNGIKNKLALIVNYLFLDNKYNENDKIIEIVDDVVRNSNSLTNLINLKKQGELNDELTSTNKLSMDRK